MSDRVLAALRREYAAGGLDESDLLADPVAMFQTWLGDAVTAGIHEPNAMVVSTASVSGQPASRTVLLKGVSVHGFVFFSNYGSRKALELADNAACALLFPWHALERQVRVEGTATRLSSAENDAYFASRPRPAQLGAWASPQSEIIRERSVLEERYQQIAARFDGEQVPRPDHWGGYRVQPESVEFWQGRPGRMHDRLRYRRTSGSGSESGWFTERLAP